MSVQPETQTDVKANTQYVGRFAPSPTGPLHFGSLLACLASYLDARANGGKWLLRIEDIDETRCRPEFATQIISTLSAFGFVWDDDIIFQSSRKARYADVALQLSKLGLTYACACSRKEIADSAIAGIDGPAYPGTCRTRKLDATGNAIRVRVDSTEISVPDRVQENFSQSLATDIGDFILKRRDDLFSYQLAVVVDDFDQGVTDIVRGADLLDSTPRQIYLQRALGLPTPRYLHVPVVINHLGQKLSKQTLAPAVTSSDAGTLLIAGLAYLNQGTAELKGRSPSAILDAAAEAWDPTLISKTRVLAQSATNFAANNQ